MIRSSVYSTKNKVLPIPMNETIRNENNFIGYEYKDVTVRREAKPSVPTIIALRLSSGDVFM